MKILFLIARADTVGGAQAHVRDLAVALQQEQHKVLVLTGKRGMYNTALEQEGIESVACESLLPSINAFQDGKSLRFITHTINTFKPDLISLHSSKTGILGRLASKMTKIPCTFTAHGWSFTTGVSEPSRTIYEWIEKLGAPWADKIICVSNCDRQIAIKAGMKPERLLTIHNGMKDIAESWRANLGKINPIKIVTIARFDKQKDHATLLKAFKNVSQNISQNISGAELILVGDGPGMKDTQKQVEQIDIKDRIKFLGFRQDVQEILAQGQIFVLISNWEGLPCTIIEAMRAGLPVIASDVGGVAEMVVDGVTGYCIPKGDHVLLQQRLEKLIEDHQLRQNMGHCGRQKYESEFQFSQMYRATLNVYQEVVKNNQNFLAK